MIVARVPLRVSLMGGGTDIPAVYEAIGGGATFGLSINKFMYLSLHSFSEPFFRFKYSKVEDCQNSFELQHDLARECFRITGLNITSTECASLCDVPGGTGLGSSSAFTVGLLKALNQFQGVRMSNFDLAELACDVEINRVRSPIGKQDQYLCAIGGVNHLIFSTDGSVITKSFRDTGGFVEGFSKYSRLFRIGSVRSASSILNERAHRFLSEHQLDGYRQMSDLVDVTIAAAKVSNFEKIGRMINKAWEIKCALNPSEENKRADILIKAAIDAGAFGGKLLGAGDSGFVFILAEDFVRIEHALGQDGIQIAVDFQGANVGFDDRSEGHRLVRH